MSDRGEGPGELILVVFIMLIIIGMLLVHQQGGDPSKVGDLASEIAPAVVLVAVGVAAIYALLGSG